MIKLQAKRFELNFLLKFSDLKSNFTLTPGYLNPALNNRGQFPNSAVNTSGNKSTPNSWKPITRYMKTPIVFSKYVAIQVYFRCAPYGSLVEQAYDETTPTGGPHHVFMAC